MKKPNLLQFLPSLSKGIFLGLALIGLQNVDVEASSHREAPLIAYDPLADNTDLYAFRSPTNSDNVVIIANYIPAELPYGGPNYYNFGTDVRYEIHIDNDVATPGDDIIYRFTFSNTNEDGSTFFNIRLGQQNLKTTYNLDKSTNGGATFTNIITGGIVPPNNIGARSINDPTVGLGSTYASLMTSAINTSSPDGEMVFAGPIDDPFFVDLGGIFDLGDAPRQNGAVIRDGLARYNVHSLVLEIPITELQKTGANVSTATSIIDPDFVIGVWASASRQSITTLNTTGGGTTTSGNWTQVSRLGMPLTNEVVIPIGDKDLWNSRSPYGDSLFYKYAYNPELALYMDTDFFASAVPAFAALRIQKNSLGSFDFTNGADGLFGLKGNPALAGTAMAPGSAFEDFLLPAAGSPRSIDLNPIFHTGVPALRPYHLATGKGGDPLAGGKPFIHNFLPNGGDMLRLNMATPVTPRNDPKFSSLGLVQAAVLGLTDTTYNQDSLLQFIPNMDGFPNGRRLEDDVTRIELQAVSGVVLAAVGLWYDDFDPATSPSPVTNGLLNVLQYSTGVEANDVPFQATFPYVAAPHRGTDVAQKGTE